MGSVYEAERADGAFEQRIAVKFIRLSASPQAPRRFEREHRYLHGLPVLARPPTWRYRAGMFVRRHWVALSLAALVLALGVGGLGALVTQRSALRLALAQAETDRDRTAATAARQQKTQEFVLGLLDTREMACRRQTLRILRYASLSRAVLCCA